MDDRAQQERIAQLELDNARLKEQLTAALGELDAFAYAVSHDLRAPLRSLSGFSQALAESLSDSESQSRHYLDRIQQASRKMSQLIDALLQLSRIARAEMNVRDVDFTELCTSAASAAKANHSDRKIDVEIEPGLRALGDHRMLRTVMDALLENAIKFSSKRAETRIRIRRTGPDSFSVADNGVGFDPAYRDKLFKPFQRLHAETDYPGVGIGLAVVQRVITRHNGEARIESTPEVGTEVLFRLKAGIV